MYYIDIDWSARSGNSNYSHAVANNRDEAICKMGQLMERYGNEIYLLSLLNSKGLRVAVWREGSTINTSRETDRAGRSCVVCECYYARDPDEYKWRTLMEV